MTLIPTEVGYIFHAIAALAAVGVAYIFLAIVALAAVAAIVLVLRMVVCSIIRKEYMKLRCYLFSILCVLIAAASWVFNLGWFRTFITMSGIPVVHAILFFFMNSRAAAYFEKSSRMKLYTRLSGLFYLGAYLLFPDGGDYGPMYMFFGLIRSDTICTAAFFLSFACLTAHVVMLVMQYNLRTSLRTDEQLGTQTKLT